MSVPYNSMAAFSLVFRLCLWIIYFTLAIIGTVHRDDKCGASRLGLAMVLALAASCTQAVFFVVCDLFIELIVRLMPEDAVKTKVCETTNLAISSLPTIFGFCVSIFMCVQLAIVSRQECTDMLYNVALGYVVTFFVNAALHLAILCGTCFLGIFVLVAAHEHNAALP